MSDDLDDYVEKWLFRADEDVAVLDELTEVPDGFWCFCAIPG